MTTSMYDIIVLISGQPSNDVQALVLYIIAIMLSVFFVMLLMYVFILIAKVFRSA